MARNDGGSAFPGDNYTESGLRNGYSMGMSLRDYFAGQAVNGLISCAPFKDGVSYSQVTREAYKWADAMLAEREKVNG